MVSLWEESLRCRTMIIFIALTSNFPRKPTIKLNIVQFKLKLGTSVKIFAKF